MAQRTVALYKGRCIGIESIYTVSAGRQINIPEKVEALRKKSRNNELFCPCGCGANLILIAGDRSLREQHFRIKDGKRKKECHYVMEGEESIHSKIILKCWLEDKLQVSDIESRVPVKSVAGIDRKYEFTFLSRSKHLAVSYCRDRENLLDEKLEFLSSGRDIQIIYVVDQKTNWQMGQYPEWLMKIQKRQGYCLLLIIDKANYNKAKIEACIYMQDRIGCWKKYIIASGFLSEFDISEDGSIVYENSPINILASRKKAECIAAIKLEQELLQKTEEKRRQQLLQMSEEMEKRREEENRLRRELEEGRRRHIEQGLLQQEHPVRDEQNRRWVKCEHCGRVAVTNEFAFYGGTHHENLGICVECSKNSEVVKKYEEEQRICIEKELQQQESPVIDEQHQRWVRCEFCGRVATEKEFVSYGGPHHVNLGICKECNKNNPEVDRIRTSRRQTLSLPKKVPIEPGEHLLVCKECGGNLIERNGRYGKFWGCSNYPKCRYTEKYKK